VTLFKLLKLVTIFTKLLPVLIPLEATPTSQVFLFSFPQSPTTAWWV